MPFLLLPLQQPPTPPNLIYVPKKGTTCCSAAAKCNEKLMAGKPLSNVATSIILQ
jgi:hypothetical protein